MGRIPAVCLFLCTLCFCALEGNAQIYDGAFEPVNSVLDNKQASKVNQLETSNIPLPSNSDNSRLSNVIAFKYRGDESEISESNSSSWRNIVYRVVIALFIGSGLLIALSFFLKSLIKKIKQKRMQEEFSMTYHDAKLSSQFLSDLSGSERSEGNTSNLPTEPAVDKPVIIDIPTATAPIPTQICITSPKGETRKSVRQMEDFVRVELNDDRTQSIVTRRTSSLPSLSSDQSSSSPESRDSYRRDAVLLYSDDEDLLADLKKKRKKQKKAWKKIIKASQLKDS